MRSILESKKGQTGGLITGLVFGVASLVIAVIIALVIVSTLNDANLLDSGQVTATIQVDNETGFDLFSNSTFAVSNVSTSSYTVINMWNETNQNGPIATEWYQTDQIAKLLFRGNATPFPESNATNVTYTYVYTISTGEQDAVNSLTANFTEGIDKVSDKIPTALLVAAIVLILGVLAILVGVWQRMRMGGGSTL